MTRMPYVNWRLGQKCVVQPTEEGFMDSMDRVVKLQVVFEGQPKYKMYHTTVFCI